MAGVFRNNANFVISPSATGRTKFTSLGYVNEAYRGIRLYVDITTKSSAGFKPGFKLQGSIPGTTKFQTLWASTPASTTVQTIKVLVMPGASTLDKSTAMAYTKVINDFLPPVWRITSTSILSTQGSSQNGKRAAFSISADLLQ